MVTQQKIPERFWCVKQIDIFRDLAEDDANALERITTFKQLKHEDAISTEGVYLLKEGRVKIYETPPEGEAITLDVLESGEIFGAVEWEERHRNVTAEVLTEATVGVVSAKNFQFFLKRKPHLALPSRKTFGSFVKWYPHRGSGKSGKLNLLISRQKPRRRMTNPLLNIAFRSPASRLALLLQNCADTPKQGRANATHGSQCTLRKLPTRKLARLIGSSVENMEALLNQFKQHGIIEKRYRRIQILDPWQLKKIANARMETLPPKTVESQENTQTYEQEEPLFAARPTDGR
ncbi:MAG: Crp/Fnr family transcriptional regulator [Candidatus Poribacteria bacterium]|nr:Crp/Fnr family transcriptional regulator [Candidatus Poribacteria bacterium]